MFDRVLIIGAHTDDCEIYCGGTIAKFIEYGVEVHYTTFSFANKSLPEGFPEGITKDEVVKSTNILGIPFLNLNLYDYEVRVFSQYRQDILEDLIRLRNDIKPNLVITHNLDDMHQDHKVISEETYRAFKQTSTIWGYESFKNNRVFHNDLYMTLHSTNIEKKIQALSMYKSQLIKYNNIEAVKALAKVRGSQIEKPYAECFQVMRYIL